MKKCIFALSVIVLIICMSQVVMAQNEERITVEINGTVLNNGGAEPFMKNDRVMIPLRVIAESMGADVHWQRQNAVPFGENPVERVTIQDLNHTVLITLGENYATVNGSEYYSDVAPVKENGFTFVPVRFFAETLGAQVEWVDESQTVKISGKGDFYSANGKVIFSMPFGTMERKYDEEFCESDVYFEYITGEGKITAVATDLAMVTTGNLGTDCEKLGYDYTEAEDMPFDAMKAELGNNTIGYLTSCNNGRLVLIKIFYDGENMLPLAYECAQNVKLRDVSLVTENKGGYRFETFNGKYEVFTENCESGEKFTVYEVVSPGEKRPFLNITLSDSEITQIDGITTVKKHYSTFINGSVTWYFHDDENFSIEASGKLPDGTYFNFSGSAYSNARQLEFAKFVSRIAPESGGMAAKPVIYLYPEEKTDVSVQLELNGDFLFTYPEYRGGWEVTAFPDGTVISGGEEYSYIFWEGTMPCLDTEIKEGFVVSGSESAEFLRKTLGKMGLTPREYNEFIVYWAPLLAQNEYNKITFAGDEYTSQAKLSVSPQPDSILRVFMIWEECDGDTVLKPQEIKPFERNGFTVVEWGGYRKN